MTIPSPPPLPPAAQAPTASTQAITALVLGILGLTPCCGLVAPVAWYLGNAEGKLIRAGRAPAAGETVAKIGFVLGIIGTIELAFVFFWTFVMGGLTVITGLMQNH